MDRHLFNMTVRPQSLIIVAALTLSIGCTEPANQLPNIVLIISDDQGWTDYGFMGHPEVAPVSRAAWRFI